MTTAVNNQTNQDVYAALGLNGPNSNNKNKKKDTLDQADFLRLMTQQLQHQDPLKPMDNTQMVAQMAQMSTVQGITDLNKTVKGFQESMASDQVLRGAALVGHNVLVPSPKMVLGKEGDVSGVVAAPSAGFVTVDITDDKGNKVTQISVEAKAAGEVTFKWDGKDSAGNRMPAGDYTATAKHTDAANKETKLSTYMQAPVESVTVGSDGLYLNLKGLGTAPMSYVLRVS
ncbi:flagellar hook capping FlgD N-terminal domain-containing protein [Stenotrophomonas sp. 24(2023)]|uniref:flagellar hook assembly protein FlgD n=1 Tax=Stenotrophomonas sp. 24(2023) TaxID=3068324 RepID=UPI0027E0B471|nr:flagellar hook capping FlgD N-terminal domain-containing protein [Stenotrophomonas sp. 24(2023)]WMJ69134.1 flagellar hook capping FlgD N-terminal domain-containing protein [Stenotrophomonas sp. 24(2023)]